MRRNKAPQDFLASLIIGVNTFPSPAKGLRLPSPLFCIPTAVNNKLLRTKIAINREKTLIR